MEFDRTPTIQRAPGFSLVELLTVVAVISVLAGLLAPVIQRVRAKAAAVGCRNHLRQWGLATHLFAGDHQDLLPSDGAPNGISTQSAWYVDLPLELGIPPYPQAGPWRTNSSASLPRTVWLCPGNSRRSNGRILFHYCLNRRVNGSGDAAHQRRLGSLPAPSSTGWLFDNGRLAAVATEGNIHTNLHSAGAQILFLDGHVTHLPAKAYWDFRRNRPLPEPKDVLWNPW